MLNLLSATTRPIKVWSPQMIGRLTLVAVIVIGAMPSFSGGFLLLAWNSFRMKLRWKALFHLLAIPIIMVFYPLLRNRIFGAPNSDEYLNRGGELPLIFDFVIAFLVIAYLHKTTEKDIERAKATGLTLGKAGGISAFNLAALGFGAALALNTYITQSNLAAYQNHVYCELIKPGMTQDELRSSLAEIDQFVLLDFGERFGSPQDGASYYRTVDWKAANIEWDYDLWLTLGFNKEDKVVWEAREQIASDFTSTLKIIHCPWTVYSNSTP